MKRNSMGIVISALSMALIGSMGIGVGISILQAECSDANQQVLLASTPTVDGENTAEYEWHLEKTPNGKSRLIVSILQ